MLVDPDRSLSKRIRKKENPKCLKKRRRIKQSVVTTNAFIWRKSGCDRVAFPFYFKEILSAKKKKADGRGIEPLLETKATKKTFSSFSVLFNRLGVLSDG